MIPTKSGSIRLYCSDKIRRSNGVYTEDQVARCCQLGGQFGRHLDDLFLHSLCGDKPSYQRTKYHVNKTDVASFVEQYQCHDLWKHVPGRAHAGFENIRHELKINDCAKFVKRIETLSERLDVWKRHSK